MTMKSNLAPSLAAAVLALACSSQAAAALCPHRPGIEPQSETSGQYMVRFRAPAASAAADALQARELERAAAAVGAKAKWLRRTAIGDALVRIEGPDRAAKARALQALSRRTDIEYVVLDARVQAYSQTSPNDSHYLSGNQWALNGANGINAPAAWALGTGGGEVIAIVDTGITAHTDLAAHVVTGYDFITDKDTAADGNETRDDDASDPGDAGGGICMSPASSWHGTHVAGIAAAIGDNAKGVAGVAYGATILPVRVLGVGGGVMSDVIDGIKWAAGGAVSGVPANTRPASVINLSLGHASATCEAPYQIAIDQANALGAVVVASAGNSGVDAAGHSPSNCAGVITVAATTSGGLRSSSSNKGPAIDIAAPGDPIVSTINLGSTSPGLEGYGYKHGTSMAAPHVSGVAALMQSEFEHSPLQVLDIMKRTARSLATECPEGCGAGLIDAGKAVTAAATWPKADFTWVRTSTGTCATTTPTYRFSSSSTDPNNDPLTIEWRLNGVIQGTGPTWDFTGDNLLVTMVAKDKPVGGNWTQKTVRVLKTCP